MNILFINPISINRDALPVPPLGILYLVAFLRDNGYKNITVIDNDFERLSLCDIETEIKKHDVICVTGTTPQFKQGQEISYIAKEHGKVSIAGGPHATAVPSDMLKKACFDYVVVGEGELSLLDLINALDNKRPVDNVQGIVFLKNDEIFFTGAGKFIKNIDMLPFPARDIISMDKYGNKEIKRFDGTYTHMMTSRGCGHKCIFCSSKIMWKYCRLASASRVFEEMMFLYNTYNIKNIHFQDDNFTTHNKRAMELCDLIINSGIGFKWSCQTRPSGVNLKLLKKMKEAGCEQVEFGVESGDEEMLIRIKKKYTKKQIKKAFDLAREAGINTYGFFIVGLPGETIISWIKTILFAKQLNLNESVWTVLVPFPGTEIYEKRLVIIIDEDYTNWTYKQPVIRSGIFGPTALRIMRWISDKLINGFFNAGTYKPRRNI